MLLTQAVACSFLMRDRYPHPLDPAEPLDAARSAGRRRLSRLTWRATQLGALATVGFATLFARTAPAQTVSSPPHPTPSAHASSPAPSPSPSATKAHRRHHHRHHRAGPGAAAAPSSTAPSSAAPAPTLAPPTTAPAPPPPSPKPSPVQTTSSPSHHGGG